MDDIKVNFLKNIQGKDLSNFKGKSINEVPLFETKDGKEVFNEKLSNKDDFVSMLQIEGDEKSVSKEDLEGLYSMLDVDNNGKLSEKELKLLSLLGGADKENVIDVDDIGKLAEISAKEAEKTETPEKPDKPAPDDDKKFDKSAILKNDSRIKEENGKKYVTVENYKSDGSTNGSLNSIIKNCYDLEKMGIKEGSSEFKALQKAVMDANPEIYGGNRKTAGGEGRENTILYTDEKLILPDFMTSNKTAAKVNDSTRPAGTQETHFEHTPSNDALEHSYEDYDTPPSNHREEDTPPIQTNESDNLKKYRGLQADLNNKTEVYLSLNKKIEELKQREEEMMRNSDQQIKIRNERYAAEAQLEQLEQAKIQAEEAAKATAAGLTDEERHFIEAEEE